MYFDSHAHLTEDCFAQDFDSIVENMKAASVTGMMEIGFDLPSSEKAVQLAERFRLGPRCRRQPPGRRRAGGRGADRRLPRAV